MSNRLNAVVVLAVLLLFSTLLAACAVAPAAPQATPPPPTAEEIPPTETLPASTETAVPTATPIPATATPVPTAPVEPTATEEPTPEPTPTATMLPPLSGSGGGVIAYISESGVVPGLQIMNADGTDQRRLSNAFDSHPTFSPDGQQIAFSSDSDEQRGLHKIDLLSGELTSLSRFEFGEEPSSHDWSPDGTRFAVVHDEGPARRDIYVLNADGSGLRQISDALGTEQFDAPDWSPDGTQLVFLSNLDGGEDLDIYTSNADGSNPVRLLNSDSIERFPAWSPDGTKIAFETNLDGNWEIYTINVDGSGLQNVSNSPDSIEGWPAWSPDGARIAFQSNRDGNWEIYVMNADGTEVQRLTDNEVKDTQPVWQP
jgi:Tol biopolymer transport system component